MWDCARLTTRPTRLDFRAAPHGPFSKRVTKAMGSQQRSLNACCGPLSSRHAPARSWWNTSRKSPLVSMVGAGNNNSESEPHSTYPSPTRVSLYDHTFKWGLNYKFDSYWGKAPRPSKAPTQEGDRPPARFSLGEGGHGGLASWCATGAKPLERYCHHNGAR